MRLGALGATTADGHLAAGQMALDGDAVVAHDDAMTADELTALLAATWFARDLSPGARDHLAALAAVTDIPEGTTVLRDGDVCHSIGVVDQGPRRAPPSAAWRRRPDES